MSVPPLDLPPVEELVGETPRSAAEEELLGTLITRVEELDRRVWKLMEGAVSSPPAKPNATLPDDPAGEAIRFDEV
jgi:hypothetical protein